MVKINVSQEEILMITGSLSFLSNIEQGNKEMKVLCDKLTKQYIEESKKELTKKLNKQKENIKEKK